MLEKGVKLEHRRTREEDDLLTLGMRIGKDGEWSINRSSEQDQFLSRDGVNIYDLTILSNSLVVSQGNVQQKLLSTTPLHTTILKAQRVSSTTKTKT